MLPFDETPPLGKSSLFGMSARSKIIAALLIIMIIVSVNNLKMLLLLDFLLLLLIPALGINIKRLAGSIKIPLLIAVFITIIHPFTMGENVIATLGFLNLYYEGMVFGLIIFLRVISAVTIFNLLFLTTPFQEIMDGARKLGVPGIFMEIMYLMARFIRLFSSQLLTMNKAQRSRLGYTGDYSSILKDYGSLSGKLIIRSFDRATRIHRAMLSRCYHEGNRDK